MELTETYLKGFNRAYVLAQHTPDLLEKLLVTQTENDFIQGMRDGKNVFEQEQSQNQSNDRLNQLSNLRSKGEREEEQEL